MDFIALYHKAVFLNETTKSPRKQYEGNDMTNSALQHNLIGKSYLPEHYQPSASDVVCARGTKSLYHSGNMDFRKSIADNLVQRKYGTSSDKREKSMIISEITNKFYFNEEEPRKFIRFCDARKRWYEISYDQVRQKVGQTIRDTLIQQDPQRLSRKNHSRARRASAIRRCVPTIANCRISHSFATRSVSMHPDEHLVSSKHDHVKVSANPQAASIECRGSTLSRGQTPHHHHEAIPFLIHVQINASPRRQQPCHDLALENQQWPASVGETLTLKAADVPYSLECGHGRLDSDTMSVSSCHWFQDCDEMSRTKCDWIDGFDGSFWK